VLRCGWMPSTHRRGVRLNALKKDEIRKTGGVMLVWGSCLGGGGRETSRREACQTRKLQTHNNGGRRDTALFWVKAGLTEGGATLKKACSILQGVQEKRDAGGQRKAIIRTEKLKEGIRGSLEGKKRVKGQPHHGWADIVLKGRKNGIPCRGALSELYGRHLNLVEMKRGGGYSFAAEKGENVTACRSGQKRHKHTKIQCRSRVTQGGGGGNSAGTHRTDVVLGKGRRREICRAVEDSRKLKGNVAFA